jgi:hypothetical protein
MYWIPFIALLFVLAALFVAALRGLKLRHAASMFLLGSCLLSAVLAGDLFALSVSFVNPQDAGKFFFFFGCINSLLTGLSMVVLTLAFLRMAQPPQSEPVHPVTEKEQDSNDCGRGQDGITVIDQDRRGV